MPKGVKVKLTTEQWYARDADAAPGQEYEGAAVKKFYICRNGHPNYLKKILRYYEGQRCPLCCRSAKMTTDKWYARDADVALGQEWEGNKVKKFYICRNGYGHPDYLMSPSDYKTGYRCPLKPCNPMGKPHRPPFTLKGIQPRYEFLDASVSFNVE